ILLLLIDVFADRRDLSEHRSIVELERRALARGIELEIGLAPVLSVPYVDLDLGDVEPLLGHEHANHAGVGSPGIVQLHWCSSLSGVRRYQFLRARFWSTRCCLSRPIFAALLGGS